MAGFKRAKSEQAALKIGIYSAAGGGKSLTALLIAEGLANRDKKRIAYVDTERGTDFYTQAVTERKVHPEAFDFDALYTRSLTETISAVRGLNPAAHCCVIIDSITHLWEAAKAAWGGDMTSAGTLPIQAWSKIKKPYKELINLLLNSPMHVIICGRQGVDFQNDEVVGFKMKAEGETPYEPNILFRLECAKQKDSEAQYKAFVEKDRTGILGGRTIQLWPSATSTFDLLIKPLLPLLGGEQAQLQNETQAASADADALAEEDANRVTESADLLREMGAKIDLCKTKKALKEIGKEITPELKSRMTTSDVTALREKFLSIESTLPEKE